MKIVKIMKIYINYLLLLNQMSSPERVDCQREVQIERGGGGG